MTIVDAVTKPRSSEGLTAGGAGAASGSSASVSAAAGTVPTLGRSPSLVVGPEGAVDASATLREGYLSKTNSKGKNWKRRCAKRFACGGPHAVLAIPNAIVCVLYVRVKAASEGLAHPGKYLGVHAQCHISQTLTGFPFATAVADNRWVVVSLVARTLTYYGENPKKTLTMYGVIEPPKGASPLCLCLACCLGGAEASCGP